MFKYTEEKDIFAGSGTAVIFICQLGFGKLSRTFI